MSNIHVFIQQTFIKLILCSSHDIRNWVQSSKPCGERGTFTALKFTEIQKSKWAFETGVGNPVGMASKG